MRYKIAFNISQEYYWASLKPIYDVFAKDEQYELYLRFGRNRKRFLYFFTVSRREEIEKRYREQGYRITRETSGFDVVFCGAQLKNPQRFGKAMLCNVDHGPGIKTLRYRHLLKQTGVKYHCFVEGPYRVEKFRKYGLDKTQEIYSVGLPKLDILFNNTYNRNALLEEMGLNPDKKVVLYAPSFKPTSIFLIGKDVVALSQKYHVIVKLHPYSWSGLYTSHEQNLIFERLTSSFPGFFLVPPEFHDIRPFLFVSDVIISDGSSVINEFLALERCGVIVDLPDDRLTHGDGQPLLENSSSEWLKESFIHIKPGDNLGEAVEKAMNPSPEMQKRIHEDKNYIFSHTDGKSSQRVKEIVGSLLDKQNIRSAVFFYEPRMHE